LPAPRTDKALRGVVGVEVLATGFSFPLLPPPFEEEPPLVFFPKSLFSLLVVLAIGGALMRLDGASCGVGEFGEEAVPVRPESFLTKFLGLNLPGVVVGVVKPALALGVGSVTPRLGTGVGAAPAVGVSGEPNEIDNSGGVFSWEIVPSCSGLDGGDDDVMVSKASTNSSSSSEHSVSEDSPPSSWNASALN
jgi:hypothetical protein